MKTNNLSRCHWIEGKPDYYVQYHDEVWGKPEHNDQQLFRWLILELFHIGLSWQLVLSKIDNFDQAFDYFDYHKVAHYNETKIQSLMDNEGIIRHQQKIRAAVNNAQAFIKIQNEFASFDHYIWSFTNGKTLLRGQGQPLLAQSDLSDEVTKDLKKRGFKFLGSVTVYSYLQAIGILNDHDIHCHFR